MPFRDRRLFGGGGPTQIGIQAPQGIFGYQPGNIAPPPTDMQYVDPSLRQRLLGGIQAALPHLGGLLGNGQAPQAPQGPQHLPFTMQRGQPLQTGQAQAAFDPNAMGMAQAPAAPSPAPEQQAGGGGLLSRIGGAASRVGGAINRGIERLTPVPQGMEGLLSDEALKQARNRGLMDFGAAMLEASGPTTGVAPSLGQALARGMQAGLGGYDEAVRTGAQDAYGGQQRQQQEAREAQRQAILQKYAPQPGETPEQANARLRSMAGEVAALGDPQLAASVASILPNAITPNEEAPRLQTIDLGDRVRIMNPDGSYTDVDKGAMPRNDTGPSFTPNQIFTASRQLRTEFDNATRDARAAHAAVRSVSSSMPRALAGDPAAQLDVLFGFLKGLDPRSVVRQSEIDLVQSASGLRSQAEGWVQRIQSGDRSANVIPPHMLQQIATFMQQREAQLAQTINEAGEYYGGLASQYGLDPNQFRVIQDSAPSPAGIQPGAAGPSVNPDGTPNTDIIRGAIPPGLSSRNREPAPRDPVTTFAVPEGGFRP